MNRKTLTLLVAVVVCGCTTTNDLTDNSSLSPQLIPTLEAKTVALSRHEPPAFVAFTPGKAMYGMVGVASQLSSGDKIVEQHRIEDPAPDIARTLADALAERYNMVVDTEQNDAPLTTGNVRKISAHYATADFIVDVYTKEWMFQYYPGNFNRYRVLYSTRFRLINTETQSVIARGSCKRDPQQRKDSPGYDELLANNAALIKAQLADAASFCANEFASNVLSIE